MIFLPKAWNLSILSDSERIGDLVENVRLFGAKLSFPAGGELLGYRDIRQQPHIQCGAVNVYEVTKHSNKFC